MYCRLNNSVGSPNAHDREPLAHALWSSRHRPSPPVASPPPRHLHAALDCTTHLPPTHLAGSRHGRPIAAGPHISPSAAAATHVPLKTFGWHTPDFAQMDGWGPRRPQRSFSLAVERRWQSFACSLQKKPCQLLQEPSPPHASPPVACGAHVPF